MILNLDSTKWQEMDNNFTNIGAIISQSHDVFVECGNDVTRVIHRQPMRKLFNGSNSVVIGNMDLNITNYSVFGVSFDSFNNNSRVVPYLFYPPLSALAWTRIGYGTVVIIADSLDNWLTKPLQRHVMKYLCTINAIMVFFPVELERAVMISQTCRIFAHVMMRKLLKLQGAPLAYDPYLVTADSDLWPIKTNMFPTVDAYNDIIPDIVILSNGCCGWFTHRSSRQKMYPMTYVRMRLSTWAALLQMHTDITDATDLTAEHIIAVFRHAFGSLVDNPVDKGQNDGWLMDQHLFSYWINQYRQTANEKVMFGNRQGMRLDHIQWPVHSSSITFDYTFDVHFPKMKDGVSWARILSFLQLMYGADSDQYQWCIQYKHKFLSYLPRDLLVELGKTLDHPYKYLPIWPHLNHNNQQ